MMRLRSLLFVPGTRPDRFEKALAAGADAVIFDLEDAVEASRKADARRMVAEFLTAAAPGGPRPQRFLRVNPSQSHWFDDDLELVRSLEGIDAVVLSKCESREGVSALAAAAITRQVLPLLETARGVLNAAAIAAAEPTIPALIFGAEDLTAEMGIPRTIDGDELIFPRSQVALAAASVGADAIDAVIVDIAALDDLRRDARRARALGFSGKMAIHPAQVPVINEVFTPSADEIARARQVIAVFEAAAAKGEGVVRLDDRMVDRPVVESARRLLGSHRTSSSA
jgi:citrate lyase beta subunit